MPSTHLSLHYHLVFSTKHRARIIESGWRSRLHDFLAGCLRTAGAKAHSVGGTDDHVHILMELRATHRLSDVVRDIKRASSLWVHEEIKLRSFAWQEGYGAFAVSRDHKERLRKYIRNQESHHRARTFQEEYLRLLKWYDVEYDQRFLW